MPSWETAIRNPPFFTEVAQKGDRNTVFNQATVLFSTKLLYHGAVVTRQWKSTKMRSSYCTRIFQDTRDRFMNVEELEGQNDEKVSTKPLHPDQHIGHRGMTSFKEIFLDLSDKITRSIMSTTLFAPLCDGPRRSKENDLFQDALLFCSERKGTARS